MSEIWKVAVLGSTRGSSLQPVIDAWKAGDLPVELVGVISNRKKSGILERAREHAIPDFFISAKEKEREAYDREVSAQLEALQADIVLCIGYMRIFSLEFVKQWYGKTVNVHPSLLPRHGGLMNLEVHQAVLDAGDPETGCTLHFIDDGVDSGPVLLQKRVKVAEGDTAESLRDKVQPLEGQAFIEMLKNWPMKAIPQLQLPE